MRRHVAALPMAALLTAALLAGCSNGSSAPSSSSSSGAPSPSESSSAPASASPEDEAALAKATVAGTDEAPELTYEWPFDVTAPVASVVKEGDGDTITAADSVVVSYVVYSGPDGTQLISTWQTGHTESIPMTGLAPQFQPLVDSIIGHKVGTRVLFGTASDLSDEASPTTSTLWLLEVQSILPKRASGEAVTPPAGLPTVTLAEDGAPSISVPKDYQAPADVVAQTLIKGDGPVVADQDFISVAYSGWLFDGTQFDSSWAKGGAPFYTQIGAGKVIEGWDKGLVGQTVGSQVLLVIPAAQAYGEQGSGQIPANSPLVFVVDILAKH